MKLILDDSLPDMKKDLSLDIATGTGFLVNHFSKTFSRVIGTDISEAQLKEARAKHADLKNVEFKQASVESLPSLLEAEGLVGEVDLFSIGQALHWMKVEETLKNMNSLLGPN